MEMLIEYPHRIVESIEFILHFFYSQNNVICEALLQFPHYLLPSNKQKMFVMLLNRVQNPGNISIGPFSELNYEMITKVSNDICFH